LVIPAVLEGIPINVIEECVLDSSALRPNTVSVIAYLYIEDGIEVCEGAFYDTIATNLQKVRWSGYYKIPADCFSEVYALEEVTNLSSVTVIGDNAFGDSNALKKIELPEGLTEIGKEAFCNCRGLSEINIPNSVSKIGNAAFGGCTGLKKVHWPANCKEIPKSCFANCKSLTDISGIDNIKAIMKAAFDSTSFSSFVIPSNCNSIEEGAFMGCKDLKTVQAEEGEVLNLTTSSFPYAQENLTMDFSQRLAVSGIESLKVSNIIKPFYSV
jgi:hypothetical protein